MNSIKVAVTDIDGILRGKYINEKKFNSLKTSGMGFCSVIFGWDSNDKCYDEETNVQLTGWHTGYHDITAQLREETKRIIPWENNKKLYLMDFPETTICPRTLLRTVVKKAIGMGFIPKFSVEYEWLNFLETSSSTNQKNYENLLPLTPGNFGYSLLRIGQNNEFCDDLLENLEKFGVPVEGFHCETGPGVYEGALEYCDALEMADKSVLFKHCVKSISTKHGIIPSFMAKYKKDAPGCGGHVHQSLWLKDINTFYDKNNPKKMSRIMEHYLAGQLYCLPYILPMFAPNINSYKRLVDGYWAPTRVGWGFENRTSTHRVIGGNQNSMRIECRVPGADANPYLVIAACLASGLYGIENELELPEETNGNSYKDNKLKILDNTLQKAIDRMESSDIPIKLFGKEFVDHFIKTRKWECREFESEVTNWETKRYFEIV